jgi:hypothetical protein
MKNNLVYPSQEKKDMELGTFSDFKNKSNTFFFDVTFTVNKGKKYEKKIVDGVSDCITSGHGLGYALPLISVYLSDMTDLTSDNGSIWCWKDKFAQGVDIGCVWRRMLWLDFAK